MSRFGGGGETRGWGSRESYLCIVPKARNALAAERNDVRREWGATAGWVLAGRMMDGKSREEAWQGRGGHDQ